MAKDVPAEKPKSKRFPPQFGKKRKSKDEPEDDKKKDEDEPKPTDGKTSSFERYS